MSHLKKLCTKRKGKHLFRCPYCPGQATPRHTQLQLLFPEAYILCSGFEHEAGRVLGCYSTRLELGLRKVFNTQKVP